MSTGFNQPIGGTDNTSSVSSGVVPPAPTPPDVTPQLPPAPLLPAPSYPPQFVPQPNQPASPYQNIGSNPPNPAYNPDYQFPGGGNWQQLSSEIQQAVNEVSQLQQYVTNSVTNQCINCSNLVDTIKQEVLQTILTPIIESQQCVSGCQQSLYSALSQVTNSAVESANNTVASCPACPPCSSPAANVQFTPPYFGSNPAAHQEPLPQIGDEPVIMVQVPSQDERFNVNIPPPVPNVPIVPQPIPPTTPPVCDIQIVTCHTFKGWCNTQDGEVRTTRDDGPNYVFPFIQVSAADTEPKALALAKQYCTRNKPRETQSGSIGREAHTEGATLSCDLAAIFNPDNLSGVFNLQALFENLATILQVTEESIPTALGVLNQLPLVPFLTNLVKAVLDSPKAIAQNIVPVIAKMTGCQDPTFTRTAQWYSVLKFFEKFAGISFGKYDIPFEYVMNSRCRGIHLSPGQAMAAYLSDAIDSVQLDELWAIEGLCHQDLLWSVQASKAKPVPEQLAELTRRGIYSPSEYAAGMRRLGYVDPAIAQDIFKLTEQVPGLGEIMRAAATGASVDSITERYQLNYGNERYMTSDLAQFARSHGISDKQLLYNWQSHWQAPGFGSQAAIWARLRHSEAFGGETQIDLDTREALTEQGVTPFWQERLLAIRNTPLGWRQLRMVYGTGSISEEQLTSGVRALGYDDDDAESIVKYTKTAKVQAAQRSQPIRLWLALALSGDDCGAQLSALGFADDDVKSIMADAEIQFVNSSPGKQFLTGELNQADMATILTNIGVTPAGVAAIVARLGPLVRSCPAITDYEIGTTTRAEAEAAAELYGMAYQRYTYLLNRVESGLTQRGLTKCVAAVSRQYALGKFTADIATALLIGYGLSNERANVLVGQWNCLQGARDKSIPAGTLCQWLSNGQITNGEFLTRLVTLGYSQEDATALLVSCLAKLNTQQAKKAQMEAKQQAQADAAAHKAAEKAAGLVAREATQLAKAQQARVKAKLRRDNLLLTAAATVQKVTTCSLPDAVGAVGTAYRALMDELYMTQDEALMVLNKAAEHWKGGDCQGYIEHALADGALVVAAQLSPVVEESVSGVQ